MSIFTAIFRALKNTLVPGLVLQFFALIILLVYFLCLVQVFILISLVR